MSDQRQLRVVDRTSIWYLSVTLIFALGLRAWQSTESLWVDELHTSWVVNGSWKELPHRARAGNQAPAYFAVAKLHCDLWGTSEFSLRFPSLVAGMLLIASGYRLVLLWTASRPAAWLCAALFAVDPLSIFYAQEARPYALVQWLGVLQLGSWCDGFAIRGRGSARYAARWASLSILLFYTHYTTAIVTVLELLLAIPWIVRRVADSRIRWQLLFWTVLPIIAGIPALPHLRVIADHRAQWPPPALQLSDLLGEVPGIGIATCLAGCGLALLIRSKWKGRTLERREVLLGRSVGLSLLISWLSLSFAAMATSWQIAALFHWRYMIIGLTMSPILMAVATSMIASDWSRWLPHVRHAATWWGLTVVILACMVSPIPRQLARDGRVLAERNEDWRALTAHLLNREQTKARPVFLCANLVEDERLRTQPSPDFLEYMSFPLHGHYSLGPEHRRVFPLPTRSTDRLAALHGLRFDKSRDDKPKEKDELPRTNIKQSPQMLSSRGFWIIVRTADERLPNEILDDFRQRIILLEIDRRSFGNLWLLEVVAP